MKLLLLFLVVLSCIRACNLTLNPVVVFSFGAEACGPLRLVADSAQSLVPLRQFADFNQSDFVCLNRNVGRHTGLGVARVNLEAIDGLDPIDRVVDPGPAYVAAVSTWKSLEVWFSLNSSLPFGEFILFQGTGPTLKYVKYPSAAGCTNRGFDVTVFSPRVDLFFNLVNLQDEFDISNDWFEQGHGSVFSVTVSIEYIQELGVDVDARGTLCFSLIGSSQVRCSSTASTIGLRSNLFGSQPGPGEYPVALYYQAAFHNQLSESDVNFLVANQPFVNLPRDGIQLSTDRIVLEPIL